MKMARTGVIYWEDARLALIFPVLLLLLHRSPFSMFLRYQRLDSLGQLRSLFGSISIGVRGRVSKEHVLLVLQLLACGAVGDPVLLVLIEMQQSFEDCDKDT